jgi:lipopolysaccharide transport system ATP-binding protein
MSSDIILKVENVSKLYRLGTVGTGTFGGDVQRFWKTKVLGQEDPFLKIGQTNDRTSKEKAEFVWALKDINFEVKRGEVLGIIGKNGAGKSTLLKLLSRITAPTTGSIKSAGRMASLLEVGTGFHPELTGRENIYLNGSILGMTKKEIQSKFDEIVDFSGCELYIDTPVKRYSSGMTVRLGFAVAAFLDPEILVVDEVLAVGDAEFQMKAIGKMKEVSARGGRTVLFVSHNMESVLNLCPQSILMDNGYISKLGISLNIIQEYLSCNFSKPRFFKEWEIELAPGDNRAKLKYVKIKNADVFLEGDILKLEFGVFSFIEAQVLDLTYRIYSDKGILILEDSVVIGYKHNLLKKFYLIEIQFKNFPISAGMYYIDCWLGLGNVELVGNKEFSVISFQVLPNFKLNRMTNIGILAPFSEKSVL